MIQKNPFLKYMIKDEKADVLHSSAYAKAQSGASIGAASSESYQVRVNINQNRQRVRAYNDSRVMTDAKMNAPHAKVYTPPEGAAGGAGRGGIGAAGVPGGATGGVSGGARPPMAPKNPGISVKR